MSDRFVNSVVDLKRRLDRLWTGMGEHCRTCRDPDCLGSIPVLPEEEEDVLDAGAETVQVNGQQGPIFLNSYPRTSTGLVVGLEKNPCPYRDPVSGLCKVHHLRPLACHMYPLALEAQPDGDIAWVLHRDCAYVRAAEGDGSLDTLMGGIRRLVAEISPDLLARIVENEKKVQEITSWPNGPNRLFVLEVVGGASS